MMVEEALLPIVLAKMCQTEFETITANGHKFSENKMANSNQVMAQN